MFDDSKAKKIIETINAGGTGKLSRSQIVVGLVNLRVVFRDLGPDDHEEVDELVAWYKAARKDKTKEVMDKARLDEVSAELMAEFDRIRAEGDARAEARIAAEEAELARLEAEDRAVYDDDSDVYGEDESDEEGKEE
ncbi:MAG: hypothetical protein PUB39_02760 [Eubacteriales bacterium]|nr:hypothetical protein [Eubacteriales bacterium]